MLRVDGTRVLPTSVGCDTQLVHLLRSQEASQYPVILGILVPGLVCVVDGGGHCAEFGTWRRV